MRTFFPTVRDPVLSLFQSAAAALARRLPIADTDLTEHPLPAAAAYIIAARADPTRAYAPPPHLAMPSLQCAGLGLELLEALIADDVARRRALQDLLSFSQCAPLWAETLIDYACDFRLNGQSRPIPYVRYNSIDDFVRPALAPRCASP